MTFPTPITEPAALATQPAVADAATAVLPAKLQVVVLLCCYNRQPKTLLCLARLQAQLQFELAASASDPQPKQVLLRPYLLDCGDDGTAQAVAAAYPQVQIFRGHAGLYWCSAMRQLWLAALPAGADFYLWLNDDVVLQDDAIPRLLRHFYQLPPQSGALVGTMMQNARPQPARDQQAPVSTADAESVPSYGGRNRLSQRNPLAFGPVLVPTDKPQPCVFINGNLCLIPAAAVASVGVLSAQFSHGLGDFDYGLRLRRAGWSLWVAPGYYGECATNSPQGSVLDAKVPFRQRLKWLRQPNILPPPAEWRFYLRQHGGIGWPLAWLASWLRSYCPALWLWLKQRSFPDVSSGQAPTPKVLIIQQVFKQYRQPLFQQLAKTLGQQGVELTLAYSLPQGVDLAKADNITEPPPYATVVALRKFGPLVWQPVPQLAQYDVVVVEQANRHLINYGLLARRWVGKRPLLVFWGHGFNHQRAATNWGRCKEWLKRRLLTLPDGFFAYTEQVAAYLAQAGVPAQRITVLNNSIDTSDLMARVALFRRKSAQLAGGSAQLSGAGDTPAIAAAAKPKLVLLFCGALYADKQLPLLLASAQLLASAGVMERLIVLGDGPDRALLLPPHHAPWLDYRGACFGEDKAQAYAQAQLVLHPGLLGLAVLDAFAAGLPVITTDFAGHSPELSYLQPGVNGLIVAQQPEALAAAVTALWQDPARLAALAEGASQSASRYSLAAMVQAFAGGIHQLMAKN